MRIIAPLYGKLFRCRIGLKNYYALHKISKTSDTPSAVCRTS